MIPSRKTKITFLIITIVFALCWGVTIVAYGSNFSELSNRERLVSFVGYSFGTWLLGYFLARFILFGKLSGSSVIVGRIAIISLIISTIALFYLIDIPVIPTEHSLKIEIKTIHPEADGRILGIITNKGFFVSKRDLSLSGDWKIIGNEYQPQQEGASLDYKKEFAGSVNVLLPRIDDPQRVYKISWDGQEQKVFSGQYTDEQTKILLPKKSWGAPKLIWAAFAVISVITAFLSLLGALFLGFSLLFIHLENLANRNEIIRLRDYCLSIFKPRGIQDRISPLLSGVIFVLLMVGMVTNLFFYSGMPLGKKAPGLYIVDDRFVNLAVNSVMKITVAFHLFYDTPKLIADSDSLLLQKIPVNYLNLSGFEESKAPFDLSSELLKRIMEKPHVEWNDEQGERIVVVYQLPPIRAAEVVLVNTPDYWLFCPLTILEEIKGSVP